MSFLLTLSGLVPTKWSGKCKNLATNAVRYLQCVWPFVVPTHCRFNYSLS